MAKKTTRNDSDQTTSLESIDANVSKPRLKKLIIRNFRCITKPVTIDLDEIVILVGENNSGKSSILKAYEVAMSQGSSASHLTIEDFPNAKLDPNNYPEIELETIVYDNSPGEKWINVLNEEKVVRERWIWKEEGPPTREGFNVVEEIWDSSVPWGAPNIANSRRPIPHRIDAFADPKKQADVIVGLLMNILKEKIKENTKTSNVEKADAEKSKYQILLEKIAEVQAEIVEDTQSEIDNIQTGVSQLVSSIFPEYVVEFDARAETNVEDSLQLFKSGASLKMGPKDGFKSEVDKHGSGAQRTLLWSALKFIEENGLKSKKIAPTRPHVLLMDEPELCLHPNAVREACNVLYDLPQTKNWQVMITTHSPVFINLSKDNTTIIRVAKDATGTVEGVTLYRPDKIKLSPDEREELKMLNMLDSHLAEFFFTTKNIIVEGDTEYTALKYVIDKNPEKFKDVHIIRARGKAPIISIVKILNTFSSQYAVLHDSDLPLLKNGNRNPAWTINQSIFNAVKEAPAGVKVRLVASKNNFENAFLSDQVKSDKPYNALMKIKETDEVVYGKIAALLEALLSHDKPLPEGVVSWDSLEDLEGKVGS